VTVVSNQPQHTVQKNMSSANRSAECKRTDL